MANKLVYAFRTFERLHQTDIESSYGLDLIDQETSSIVISHFCDAISKVIRKYYKLTEQEIFKPMLPNLLRDTKILSVDKKIEGLSADAYLYKRQGYWEVVGDAKFPDYGFPLAAAHEIGHVILFMFRNSIKRGSILLKKLNSNEEHFCESFAQKLLITEKSLIQSFDLLSTVTNQPNLFDNSNGKDDKVKCDKENLVSFEFNFRSFDKIAKMHGVPLNVLLTRYNNSELAYKTKTAILRIESSGTQSQTFVRRSATPNYAQIPTNQNTEELGIADICQDFKSSEIGKSISTTNEIKIWYSDRDNNGMQLKVIYTDMEYTMLKQSRGNLFLLLFVKLPLE